MSDRKLSVTESEVRSLGRLEWGVGLYAVMLVTVSIVMFLMSNTSDRVNELIAAQNEAALKLWVNLDYYDHHHAKTDPADTSLPPGLFEGVVEFSRTNANIIKTVHRLSLKHLLSRGIPIEDTLRRLKPTDGKQPAAGQDHYFDRFGVDPHTDKNSVVQQGMYQIELYQAIRDYAQDESGFYKNCLGAVSVYVLPVFYALLGSFLWAFRSSCQQVGAGRLPSSPDRSSRFVMAGIAGIAISALGPLLPKDALLSPLAVAFLIGYSIDVFTSRLDAYIDNWTKGDQTAGAGKPA